VATILESIVFINNAIATIEKTNQRFILGLELRFLLSVFDKIKYFCKISKTFYSYFYIPKRDDKLKIHYFCKKQFKIEKDRTSFAGKKP
jgi:hypothetical protein